MNVKSSLQNPLESGDRPPVNYDRAATCSGLIAEKDVAVPDRVNICIDLYRPEAGGKFPALLAFSIYNKDLQGPEVAKRYRHGRRGRRSGRGCRRPAIRNSSCRAATCDRFAAGRRQIRRRRVPAMGRL
jgi:predicted acyl esterase